MLAPSSAVAMATINNNQISINSKSIQIISTQLMSSIVIDLIKLKFN